MSNESERPQAECARDVAALYSRNYQKLVDTALSDKRILVADGKRIAESIKSHLKDYEGPLDDQDFQAWAIEIINAAAEQVAQFYELLKEDGWAIRAGIRSALGCGTRRRNQFDDTTAVAEELFIEVAYLVFERLADFLKPGTAKRSTCLFALARRHTLDYYVKKQARRHAAVARRLAAGGRFHLPEIVTNEEIEAAEAELQYSAA